jgi:hypothetical protein
MKKRYFAGAAVAAMILTAGDDLLCGLVAAEWKMVLLQ